MRLVQIAPTRVTVGLSIVDRPILACGGRYANRHDEAGLPPDLTNALASGLVAQAFAAYLLDNSGESPTLRGMWAMWAWHDERSSPPRQVAIPSWLPCDDRADE